ncbi:MAG TPA: hypothetical protein PK307_07725 [Spirochaetota bacterium]|nr:hypothetical protein [Spirochaetota bacterium]HOD14524.1 hypothetical protein [Spirochaetota bacterium]HPG49567.1 hypothetical protein [Spirochaetota bacterium]HPN13991.1 hypothetical protein [Spirochaetota bacterium]HQL82076.1 hypothetical protein [Spirochaetota bacterium]
MAHILSICCFIGGLVEYELLNFIAIMFFFDFNVGFDLLKKKPGNTLITARRMIDILNNKNFIAVVDFDTVFVDYHYICYHCT